MNILVDNHHGALLRSMYYLFKKRFGFNVYVPHGMEWLDIDNLYQCYQLRATASQMLNSWIDGSCEEYNDMFIPLKLEKFLEIDIDIIICTLYENYEVFQNIIKKYNKNCKLILQVGNNLPICYADKADNLLCSAYPTFVKASCPNKIFYHQEFGLQFYNPSIPSNIKSIVNFKHCMGEDKPLFDELKNIMPDWDFKAFGHNNYNENLPDKEIIISNKMKEFGFIFHVKQDEGYGHIIHGGFACGKPMIINLKKSAACVGYDNNELIQNTSSFLFDETTIIDSNIHITDIVNKLRIMADNYEYYSNNVYNKFKNIVDFDKEFLQIKKFIENLI